MMPVRIRLDERCSIILRITVALLYYKTENEEHVELYKAKHVKISIVTLERSVGPASRRTRHGKIGMWTEYSKSPT